LSYWKRKYKYQKKNSNISKEEFEDTKGVVRIETGQTTHWPKEKG
jgi:hypothetical protein